ncbi:hypothetical protein VQ048_08110 [Bergeyella sp. RCAD1439]|nr:hypothetical protein [Bergeyella sp. RCAD1439]
MVSCLEVDCNRLREVYSEEECLIVIEKPPKPSTWFHAEGINPMTNKPCECKSANRWWSLYSSEIQQGDTIFKKRGELSFNIHKKDTVITHYWECNGKVDGWRKTD